MDWHCRGRLATIRTGLHAPFPYFARHSKRCLARCPNHACYYVVRDIYTACTQQRQLFSITCKQVSYVIAVGIYSQIFYGPQIFLHNRAKFFFAFLIFLFQLLVFVYHLSTVPLTPSPVTRGNKKVIGDLVCFWFCKNSTKSLLELSDRVYLSVFEYG